MRKHSTQVENRKDTGLAGDRGREFWGEVLGMESE